jgi:uncharacterized protein (TIGR03118 family)
MRRFHSLAALLGPAVLALCPAASEAGSYRVTRLVSDIDGLAQLTDHNLQNPWGIALSGSSPFWISDAASLKATVYSGDVNGRPLTVSSTVVDIPGPPTGQVAGAGSAFNSDRFIFSTLDGRICGWGGGATAATRVTVSGASYNGLAIGTGSDGNPYLWAANTRGRSVDVFDSGYNQVSSPGGFADPNLESKYSPYNVQLIKYDPQTVYLFVTYIDTTDPDDGGVVNVFDTDGNFQWRFATGGTLNAPWGVALAPGNFGRWSGTVLVGNFGDGRISVFDIYGDFLDLLRDREGNPWVFDGLWGLSFGNGGSGGDTNALYFTAGINNQVNGLLGSIRWHSNH